MYLVLFPSTPILSSVSIFVALPPPDEVLFTHLTPLASLFKNAWTINKDVFFFLTVSLGLAAQPPSFLLPVCVC